MGVVKERSRGRSRFSKIHESEGVKQMGETEFMLWDEERKGDPRVEESIETGEAKSDEVVELTAVGIKSFGDGSESR